MSTYIHCKLCSDEIDLLLLGAAEAGKSTLLKQMRIIHKADYGLEERIMFKPIVYANAIHSMSLILHAVERLGIDLDSEESEYDAYVFYQLLEEQTSHMHTLVEDIKVTKELSKVALAVCIIVYMMLRELGPGDVAAVEGQRGAGGLPPR